MSDRTREKRRETYGAFRACIASTSASNQFHHICPFREFFVNQTQAEIVKIASRFDVEV